MKLRKIVKVGATVQYEQDYLGGLEYRKNGTGSKRIEAVYHAEGRYLNLNAEVNNTLLWQKEYTLKDHLGNARVTFTDKNLNGIVDIPSDIVQENHYYPFGLNYEGAWRMNDVVAKDTRYQYNGKEWNDDFGLNWNDYGARFYDAAIGRWGQVDPMAEKYLDITPYAYVANNPIKLYDPTGMIIEYADDISKEDKKAIRKQVNFLRKNSDTFRQMWKDLKKSEHTHTIHAVSDSKNMRVEADSYSSEGSSTNIYLHPSENGEGIAQEVAIGHEIGGHAWRFDQGLEAGDLPNNPLMSMEDNELAQEVHNYKRAQVREMEATHIENIIRSELHQSTGKDYGIREFYGRMTDVNTTQYNQFFSNKKKFPVINFVNVPGTIPNYNYQGNNHYEALKRRKAVVPPLNLPTKF